MPEMTMDEAIQSAIKLKDELAQKDATTAYPELEKAVRAFENEGYPLEAIIPQGADARLGFTLKSADGKTFFQVYSNLIRKNLCAPGGEFNKLIKSGLNTSVGAVLTAIVTSLGIPFVALGVIIPIAVIIANTGLDAFCEINKKGT